MLVVALPAVEQPQLPPLHAVNPKEIYCAGRTALVLPVDGAPLVFSTGYAHDVTLSLAGSDGKSIDLPATADAAAGWLRRRHLRTAFGADWGTACMRRCRGIGVSSATMDRDSF